MNRPAPITDLRTRIVYLRRETVESMLDAVIDRTHVRTDVRTLRRLRSTAAFLRACLDAGDADLIEISGPGDWIKSLCHDAVHVDAALEVGQQLQEVLV